MDRREQGAPKWYSIDYIRENMLTLLTIVIVAFMLFMIGRNAFHAARIRYEIAVLRGDERRYQERITRDSTMIESLRYDAELERYARENYFMQRKNEEIFIIEGEK